MIIKVSCVAVPSYQEINLKYVALYKVQRDIYIHTSFFFLQEKLMAKINYFLCEYIQVSYVYCVSYDCCQQKKCSSTFLFFFVKQRGYFCWAFHIRFRAWLTQNLTFCFKKLAQYKALSDSVFFAFDKNGDKLCLKSHFVSDKKIPGLPTILV